VLSGYLEEISNNGNMEILAFIFSKNFQMYSVETHDILRGAFMEIVNP
jgi:hypothetical protein